MRTCKICNQEKPYDPTAKRQSKAQGFVGNVCWACHVKAQRTRVQKAAGTAAPEYLAHKQEVQVLKAQLLVAQRDKTKARLKLQHETQEKIYADAVAKQHEKNARRIAQQDAARISLNARLQGTLMTTLSLQQAAKTHE